MTNLLAFASYGPGDVSNVFIHDNNITRTGVPFVYDQSNAGVTRHGWTVARNTVSYELGSPQPGLLFGQVNDVNVCNNQVEFQALQPTDAVGMWSGSSGAIRCNWFHNARSVVVK